MLADIQKWGNSQGIRLPKAILDIALLKQNDRVEITAEENRIIIRKAPQKKHITLEERLRGYNGEYVFDEADWGKSVGNEIW